MTGIYRCLIFTRCALRSARLRSSSYVFRFVTTIPNQWFLIKKEVPHNVMKTIHEPAYHRLVAELRQARAQAGLTQAAVGQLIGQGRNWVHKIETCEVRLDVLQFVRLCRVYDLKAHDLVRRLSEAP